MKTDQLPLDIDGIAERAKARLSKRLGSPRQKKTAREKTESEVLVETLYESMPQPNRAKKRATARAGIIDQFTKDLDEKLACLKRGYVIQATYRIDFLKDGQIVLRSPNKRATRKTLKWSNAVRSRDNFTCQHCGINNTAVDAHHIKSWAEHPELKFDVSNGITLCIDCHAKQHPKLLCLFKNRNRSRRNNQ